MKLKTSRPKICPNCLQFKRNFVICECETVLCGDCAITFFDEEKCPSCYSEIPGRVWDSELRKHGVRG